MLTDRATIIQIFLESKPGVLDFFKHVCYLQALAKDVHTVLIKLINASGNFPVLAH